MKEFYIRLCNLWRNWITPRSNCPAEPDHEPLGRMKPGDNMSKGGQISYLYFARKQEIKVR